MVAAIAGDVMNAAVQQRVPVGESLPEALDRIYRRLLDAAGQARPDMTTAVRTPDHAQSPDEHVLPQLQAMFGLSPFERDVLVLCMGASVEARFPAVCAAIHADPQIRWPTFGLALSALEGAHWSAISRSRPLRFWRLIEVTPFPSAEVTLLHAPLRIDERILHHLLGVAAMDDRLEALARPLGQAASDSPQARSTRLSVLVDEGLRHWFGDAGCARPLLLCGSREASRETAFVELCRHAGWTPYQLDAADLPGAPDERNEIARLWTRESALQQAALYIRCGDDPNLKSLSSWLEQVRAPVAIDTPAGSHAERLPGLRLEIPSLTAEERKAVWVERLGDAAAARLDGMLDRIVDYFHFDESTIHSAASVALATPRDAEDMGSIAWRICRQHGRRALDNLARRIEPRADWSELVLPQAQTETLQQIAIHVRQRAVVNQQWGFSDRYTHGHGLSALFAGGSGTGKTMAAEIIARELDLDLYQIDLASMVSKYIGETEKNLRRIFDAAEESGAVLLFDEADALFGKRSEVRDSHDRYANLEVSYLLQRMDSYRGVAILTTNMRHALDAAFVRRIRFIAQFPFPDAASRERIWRGIFPTAAPLEALDFEQLAQLNVSGGAIRNIATHAAFLAAEQHVPIGMRQILAASRIEYAKMDKPLTAAETRGWS
jgi:ATPase family associated with various cellular activities (AAA)/Winged helix domain, variant